MSKTDNMDIDPAHGDDMLERLAREHGGTIFGLVAMVIHPETGKVGFVTNLEQDQMEEALLAIATTIARDQIINAAARKAH